MTLSLVMGDGLKGIVALNGYIPNFVKTEYAIRNVNDVSAFISHGQFDSVFPVRIGHETAAYLHEKMNHLTFKIYPTDHGVSEENQVDFMNWLKTDAEVNTNKE
jgi:phospholipase/carboxylesterase